MSIIMCFKIRVLIYYCLLLGSFSASTTALLFPFRNNYRDALQYIPPEQEVTFHLYRR